TKGHGINDRVDVLKTKVEGAELTTMVITDVLVGNLSHRRFDNTYSEQYKILLSEKLVEQKENIKYDKL
ncbi:MAG: hypothetical protein KGH98_04930, partial [Candidatus Micrarchaeota archaeon]|nr:hypothetical protein [Candidatus Micrarchaeota archaeon]